MFRHIVLATDGSAASAHAARLAVQLARIHGAKLSALYVIDPYPYLGVGEADPRGFQAYMSGALQHAGRSHAEVLDLCRAQQPPVEFHARTAEDVAAAAGIVQAARDTQADLVVVGSHGRTGIARLMLGSVAARVVAESPVPVLVAR